MRRSWAMLAICSVLYAATTAVLVQWLLRMRVSELEAGNLPSRQAAWDEWRAEVRDQSERAGGQGERRIPTSAEPPTVVLLRDHFTAVMGTACLIWTALFASLAFFVVGILRGNSRRRPDVRSA